MSGNRTFGNIGGDYREINNQGTYVEGNYYNNLDQKQNLAEAAAEIQQLLEQLDKTYSTESLTEEVVKGEITTTIKSNPQLLQKVLSAVKAGSISAFEQLLNHPFASFVIAALEDLQEK